jgi:hypothetical protein
MVLAIQIARTGCRLGIDASTLSRTPLTVRKAAVDTCRQHTRRQARAVATTPRHGPERRGRDKINSRFSGPDCLSEEEPTTRVQGAPATSRPHKRLSGYCATTWRRPMARRYRRRSPACRTTSKRASPICAFRSRTRVRSAPPTCSSGCSRGAATHQGHPPRTRRTRRVQAHMRL